MIRAIYVCFYVYLRFSYCFYNERKGQVLMFVECKKFRFQKLKLLKEQQCKWEITSYKIVCQTL